MHSCTWMNGQSQQIGPPSQAATRLTNNIMWNQQAGTSNTSCQYRTLNKDVRPPQSAHFTVHDGVYSNRKTSNWQTPTIPHQAVSSHQTAGVETNNYYQKVLHGNQQNSSENTPNGNPLVTNGLQVATHQDFHQQPGFINSLSPPNMMKANTIYPQQDMSAHWKQQGVGHGKQSLWMQDANVSDRQHGGMLKYLLQYVNGELVKPISAYTTTATTLPHEELVCTSQLVSSTAHNKQTAYNGYDRRNGTQHGFSPSVPPPPYNMAVSQSKRNNSTTNASREQILQVSSTSQKTQQYPVHLNPTHNNAEETIRQKLRLQTIARIADDLRNSVTASSDGCPPVYTTSPTLHYRGKQFVSEDRMTESNQNRQPVTLNVSKSYNLNASQSLPLSSGLSLPKTNLSVISRTQHSVEAPQQRSVPNVFNVTATGDGYGEIRQENDNGGKAADAIFPQSNRVLMGNPVGLLTDASQLIKLPENISPQTNKTISSVANNHEKSEFIEMLTSVNGNDSSIHSSPGRTGTRAIAVVQPLSQESYQFSSKHISSDLINQLADKSVINHSAASIDGTLVSSSESTGHRDISQKQLCADDTGSEQAINMQVDQHVAPTAQQSITSEVPIKQSFNKDKNENPTDPKVFELSSVPTISWTIDQLTKLILDNEKAQLKLSRDLTQLNPSSKLFSMFWGGNIKNLACKLKGGWYRDLFTDVTRFCREQVTLDSVILSQIKHSLEKQLQSYHVLKDNDVYSEPPYKSPWLNVNEQLDDIDKEFGFPCSLKHRTHMLESHSQPDHIWRVNSIPAEIVSEVPNKVLPQTELEPVYSGEEKQPSSDEFTSTQAPSPKETPSDPYYSFEIQVLPPEEAKVIFEQVQSKMQQSMDTDSQPEIVMCSSVEDEPSEAVDITLNDSKRMKDSVCPIEEVCCISRWMEQICGSNASSLSKCHCKNEQTLKDCTDNTLNKEEMSVEMEDDLCVSMSDSKLLTEGENQVKGEKNSNSQIMTYSQSELCSELNQPMALTENDHKCHYSDIEPNNIFQISTNSSQLSIKLLSENKVEDLSSSDTEIHSDPEVDCIQGQLSIGSIQSSISVSCDKEIETPPSSESEVGSHISDVEANCRPAQLTTDVASESSLETEEQTQISEMAALEATFSLSGKHETVERKRKRLRSHDRCFPIFKKSKTCKPPVDVDSQPSTRREVLVDPTESEPLASHGRPVQLVLFGSASQVKCGLTGSRKRHISSPGAVSDGMTRPPEVLSVNLSPFRRNYSPSILMQQHSAKQRIHEKWRSFSPTSTRCRRKQKTQKCSFASVSGVSLKRAATFGPNVTEKLLLSSEMRIRNWNRNAKHGLSLKRRRFLSDRLKQGEKKEKNAITLNQPADQERSNAENKSHAVMPLQENDVLRFSVLPNTFNFKDGSNQRRETNDNVSSKL